MSKTLEVYELWGKVGPRAQPGYIVGGKAVELWEIPYKRKAKRFSDAELSAEWWRAEADYRTHQYNEAITYLIAEKAVFMRMLTCPEWDEEAE